MSKVCILNATNEHKFNAIHSCWTFFPLVVALRNLLVNLIVPTMEPNACAENPFTFLGRTTVPFVLPKKVCAMKLDSWHPLHELVIGVPMSQVLI